MSDSTTRGVRVQVRSSYLPERSSPRDAHYFFTYRIRISNLGEETVQLVSRHWIITDGDGRIEEVRRSPRTPVHAWRRGCALRRPGKHSQALRGRKPSGR